MGGKEMIQGRAQGPPTMARSEARPQEEQERALGGGPQAAGASPGGAEVWALRPHPVSLGFCHSSFSSQVWTKTSGEHVQS